jgi:hypothetical protein
MEQSEEYRIDREVEGGTDESTECCEGLALLLALLSC